MLLNPLSVTKNPVVVLIVAKALGVNPKTIFLLLAYSLTIGSTTTPIGNLQTC